MPKGKAHTKSETGKKVINVTRLTQPSCKRYKHTTTKEKATQIKDK